MKFDNTDMPEETNSHAPLSGVIHWVAVDDKTPTIDDNKQLLIWDGFQLEIGRYNKWGFHYGTRNTQDMMFNVKMWAEIEPPCV